MAGKRQVSQAKYALQHNIGLGGAAVVTIYKKWTPTFNQSESISRLGYNPAIEAKKVNEAQVRKVLSSKGSLLGTKRALKPQALLLLEEKSKL